MSTKESTYFEAEPSSTEKLFVELYWTHENKSECLQFMKILPDSFFKLIVYLKEGKIEKVILVGLSTKSFKSSIEPGTKVFGIKFKILAAEYVFNREFREVKDAIEIKESSFWGLNELDFCADREEVISELSGKVKNAIIKKVRDPRKESLSELIDASDGDIDVESVSKQIAWSSRQISRYLNKYLGVSLKKYLTLRKLYVSYPEVIEGAFYPSSVRFYDQPHFIREFKKITDATPSDLHENKYDQYRQARNIKKKD